MTSENNSKDYVIIEEGVLDTVANKKSSLAEDEFKKILKKLLN